MVAELGRSGVFAARFRENAARALLLPRRRPGQRTPLWQMRQRSADLLAVASQLRLVPDPARDLPRVPARRLRRARRSHEILRDIQARKIRVSPVDTPLPSPFAIGPGQRVRGVVPLRRRRAAGRTPRPGAHPRPAPAGRTRRLARSCASCSTPTRSKRSKTTCKALSDKRKVAHASTHAHDLLRRIGDLSRRRAGAAQRRAGPRAGAATASTAGAPCRCASPARTASSPPKTPAATATRSAWRCRSACAEAFLAYTPDALLQLVRRWARTHGPFVARRAGGALRRARRTGRHRARRTRGAASASCAASSVPAARASSSATPRCCASCGNRSLAALRKQVAAVDTDAYARFLPHVAGRRIDHAGPRPLLTKRSPSCKASPSRRRCSSATCCRRACANYSPRLLDDLLAAGEILWVGAGPLGGSDGKVMLFRRDQAPLLRAVPARPASTSRATRNTSASARCCSAAARASSPTCAATTTRPRSTRCGISCGPARSPTTRSRPCAR